MNKTTSAVFVVMFAVFSAVSGQTKQAGGTPSPKDLPESTVSAMSRSRVLGTQAESLSAMSLTKNVPDLNHASRPAPPEVPKANDDVASKTRPRVGATTTPAVPASVAPNQVYKVGVGDVLDVRLLDMPTTKSTLFTVMANGMLDYPLSNSAVPVTGLTPDEIAAELRSHIKVLDNPQVAVKVRDYSSHSVIITGSVLDPGARFLRREATPLYVLLTEAQPRAEASTATITRVGTPLITVDLKDEKAVNMLVLPGDVIKVTTPPAPPTTFFYASGALNAPGQKTFHAGLTLTQAIIASGGVTHTASAKVKVSRQGSDGKLATIEYNLKQIEDGKMPDPILKDGDRIIVGEGR